MASSGTRKPRGSTTANRRTTSRAQQGGNSAGLWTQIAVAVILSVAGLLLVPLLLDNATPWLAAAAVAIRGVFGAGSLLVPVLLAVAALLLLLSLSHRDGIVQWPKMAGLLLVFVGAFGLFHWYGVLTAPGNRPAGSLGASIYSAVTALMGSFLGALFLMALVIVGAGLSLGVSSRRMKQGARATAVAVRKLWVGVSYLLPRLWRFLSAIARVIIAALAGLSRQLGHAWRAASQSLASRREAAAAADEYAPELATSDVEAELPAPTKTRAADDTAVQPAAAPTAESGGQPVNEAVRAKAAAAGWTLPPFTLLEEGLDSGTNPMDDEARLKQLEQTIEKTLVDFGVPVRVVERRPGPTVTQFGIEPLFHEKLARDGTVLRREKVKVREITARANDLALALAARSIRMEAPVPGRPYVGIEVPNQSTTVVSLRSELESRAFQKAQAKFALPIVLGRDVSGEVVTGDLAKMPHLLIAGATGSGKSVCINSIIATLLMGHTPEELRFIMIDPKRVELTLFDAIPHLLRPVVVDVEKAVPTLFQTVTEMDRRYKEFAAIGVRNIEGYNRVAQNEPTRERMPFIVVIIDELADLMMLAPDEVERTLCRLAQLARATGIHLVVATQRPSVDVVTGLIKANFPTRISFMVTSQVDSRTILDTVGAEKLLGRGDMLYLPSDAPKPVRLQGTYLTDQETEALANYWKAQRAAEYSPEFVELPSWTPGAIDETDELYDKAVELAREHDTISISFLQRKLRIGWNRAARLMEMLDENGELEPEDEPAAPSHEPSYEPIESLEEPR